MKYRYDGKEKVLSIGSYPAISLKLARDARDQAKEQLAQGLDHSAAKQQEKAQRKAQVIEQEQIEERIAYTFEHGVITLHIVTVTVRTARKPIIPPTPKTAPAK